MAFSPAFTVVSFILLACRGHKHFTHGCASCTCVPIQMKSLSLESVPGTCLSLVEMRASKYTGRHPQTRDREFRWTGWEIRAKEAAQPERGPREECSLARWQAPHTLTTLFLAVHIHCRSTPLHFPTFTMPAVHLKSLQFTPISELQPLSMTGSSRMTQGLAWGPSK